MHDATDQSLQRGNWIWEVISPFLPLAVKSFLPEMETAAGIGSIYALYLEVSPGSGAGATIRLADRKDGLRTIRRPAFYGRLDEIKRYRSERGSQANWQT
jgi:hypothetical protein